MVEHLANPKIVPKNLNAIKTLTEPFTWDQNEVDKTKYGLENVKSITKAFESSGLWEETKKSLSKLKERYPETLEISEKLKKEVKQMFELVSSNQYKGYLNNQVINMKDHCWDMYKSNVMGDKQVIKTMEDGDPEA